MGLITGGVDLSAKLHSFRSTGYKSKQVKGKSDMQDLLVMALLLGFLQTT
jgi:hypothetical protein